MESTQHAALAQPSAPADPALRLVPALVGGRRAWIECPTSWCVLDHVAENERHLEDIAHAGPMTDLVVPGGEPACRLLAHARLGADLYSRRAEGRATSVVIDTGGEDYFLSPAQAVEFADRLVAFADAVRALGEAS